MECHVLFSFRNNLKELPGHVFYEKKIRKVSIICCLLYVQERSLCFGLLQTWEIFNCIFREYRLVKDQMIILK